MAYIYPLNIESKIGFDVVRSYLRDRCQSGLGVPYVEAMEFSSDRELVVEWLRQTAEMKGAIERGEAMPEASFNELKGWITRLHTDGTYSSAEEFLALKRSLVSFDNVRTYFLRRVGSDSDSPLLFPVLSSLFASLGSFPEILREINRVIDESGLVKDSASPELAEVRGKLRSMQGSLARSIQRIFASAVRDGLADKDSAPTFRDGRMVIPVPAAKKKSLQGIVHDESATGKTVFIEPAETVELSNRMRELELEEQRIIVKILTALSDLVRPYVDDILDSNELLGRLDFIMAKARFAIEIGGNLPSIEKRPEIDWYGAVHPVLLFNLRKQGKEIVPLDIRIDGRQRMLVISGPNAGGKSVVLKTVGIIQYMCQCGVLPSMYSNSHIGIFDKIFIDIGDEQSIENDLSTYSSHLRNMRKILLHANGKSLVLIDEIGSGTEPTIGAALAKSILMELSRSRCYGVITTHYHTLKQFAEEADTFINGAMLYDRQKLQPTFKLSIGTAGSSFALEIAGKIGLPRNVIEAAKKEVGEEYVESDKFLMEIARDRKYWQSKRDSIRERENRLEVLEQKYERLIADINQKRKEIIREAQAEARQLLTGTNKKIENTIQEIREAEAEKERTKQLRKELEEFKSQVEQADVSMAEIKPNPKIKKPRGRKKERQSAMAPVTASQGPELKKDLEEGDYVKMQGSATIGKILSISGKEAEVAFGNLRTKVKLSKLTPAQRPVTNNAASQGFNILNGGGYDDSRQRQLNFKDELDIRGERADVALDHVIHFIDDAIQFGMGTVRILHGTGGGILRNVVREQLAATPGIKSFADEDVRLGGAGITVVTLR